MTRYLAPKNDNPPWTFFGQCYQHFRRRATGKDGEGSAAVGANQRAVAWPQVVSRGRRSRRRQMIQSAMACWRHAGCQSCFAGCAAASRIAAPHSSFWIQWTKRGLCVNAGLPEGGTLAPGSQTRLSFANSSLYILTRQPTWQGPRPEWRSYPLVRYLLSRTVGAQLGIP